MYIKNTVDKLIENFETNDPFELADYMGIIIIKEPLGSINGYYNKFVRQKFIHLNSNLDERLQLFVCAHELGHAVMHPDANTPFLKNKTFYSVNKLERQANIFAATLLIDDDIFNRYAGESLDYIAMVKKIPLELLKLRCENI